MERLIIQLFRNFSLSSPSLSLFLSEYKYLYLSSVLYNFNII